MPWQNPGGGSGGGSGGGGPWGGGQSPWGRGGGQRPPNLEEILRRSQDRFRNAFPGGLGGGRGVIIVVALLFLAWLASGAFMVQPNEEAVVLRFGAIDRSAAPGLRYHWPYPIETEEKARVTDVNQLDIGFRPSGGGEPGRGRNGIDVPQESLMLTKDENIVDINFTVFWQIKPTQSFDVPVADTGVAEFLFNVRHPDGTVKAAAESAMREVIGNTNIAVAFAEGRGDIEEGTKKLLQKILDDYRSGIVITQVQLQKVDPPQPVIDAFRDVQSAKIDLDRFVNEAQAYANSVVPVARGDASRTVLEAEAYKQQVTLKAQGDAARFLSVYKSYKAAEDVTARNLYLETMETVLKNANKIILDRAAAGSGVLPYLPLPELQSLPSAPAAGAGAAPSTARRGQ